MITCKPMIAQKYVQLTDQESELIASIRSGKSIDVYKSDENIVNEYLASTGFIIASNTESKTLLTGIVGFLKGKLLKAIGEAMEGKFFGDGKYKDRWIGFNESCCENCMKQAGILPEDYSKN